MSKRKYGKEHVVWSLQIRGNADNHCEVCNRTDCRLNAHHILARENWPDLQYDLNNGISLCFLCHKRLAHLDGLVFVEWLKVNKPTQYDYCKSKLIPITKV